MIRGWFIAGTDTAVGKTGVAATLLQALARKGLRAVGMKPVASGCERTPTGLRSEDAERLRAASSVTVDYADVNPYALGPAIAPHIAAAQAGIELRLEKVRHHFDRLAARADWIVVEGAGGWQVPLNRTKMLSELARVLGLPVILVVGVRLGCISHALLSARAIRADGLVLSGWVANSVDETFGTAAESIAAIDERIGAPCLARIPYNAQSWREYGDEMLVHLLV